MKLNNRKLGDGIHIKHGFAFLGKYFSDQGKYILLTPGNFYEEGGFKLRPEKDRYYLGVFPNDYLLKKDDLIIAMTEQGLGLIGSSAFIPGDNIYLHNQRIGLIDEIDKNVFDKKYLYHLFNSRGVRSQIYGSVTGTKVRHTSPGRIYKVKVLVPDVVKQKEISSIIEKYNQLINTNRRQIQLLEESARLLFREWFVYFRFPGHEKACPVECKNSTGVKIVDDVPEGWKRINFMDIISAIESGGRPKGGAVDEGIPSIGAENVNGIGNYNYSKEKYVPEEYYQKMKKGKVISKDVLLYKDGANIGRTTLVGYGYPHDKCCINEHVFILRTKNNIQNWLYFFLSQNFVQQAVANLNSNSAQPGISQDKLSSLKIIFPDEEIVRLFDDVTESMVKQIFILSVQNQKLAQARDLFLPRLMSGAIDPVRYDKLSNGVEV